MNDLRKIFAVGDKVKCKNDDFDAFEKFEDGIVSDVKSDQVTVRLEELDIDMYYMEGFNLDLLYPAYNFLEEEIDI